MPMLTKKIPSSTSRNGLISTSMRCLKWLSPSIMPAMNAPSVIDKPNASVNRAANKATNSVASTNSSSECVLATSVNMPGNTHLPMPINAANSARPLATVITSISGKPSPELPQAGIRIRNNTAAKSWNSSTATPSWPCRAYSSPPLASSRVTTAVDDSASTAAISSASIGSSPSPMPTATNAAVEISTCPPPSPNTSRRMASSRDSENSSPSENSRNTTPNSATSCTASWLPIRPSAPGPISTPVAR